MMDTLRLAADEKYRIRIPLLDLDTRRPFSFRIKDGSGIRSGIDEPSAEILIRSSGVALSQNTLERQTMIHIEISNSKLALAHQSVEVVVKGGPRGFLGQFELQFYHDRQG